MAGIAGCCLTIAAAPGPSGPVYNRISMGYLQTATSRRLNVVADLLMKGFNPQQIQQELSERNYGTFSVKLIESDVLKVKKEWMARRSQMIDERVSFELAVLENIRSKALLSFDRSQELSHQEETVTERTPVNEAGMPEGTSSDEMFTSMANRILEDADSNLHQVKTIHKVKRVRQVGDPRFLDVASNTSKHIRDLLGIDAPTVKRIEMEIKESGAYTPEELREMDREQLAALLAREINPDTEA